MRIQWSIMAFLVGASMSSSADIIVLKNGDRITGDIISKETDKVIVKTGYAGNIPISWADIKQVNTNSPVQLILNDDSILKGTVSVSQDGKTMVNNTELPKPVEINLAQVKYINPGPEVSGTGMKINGHANVGIAISDGNTDNEQYNLDTEVIMRTKVNRFTVGANMYRANENNTDTEDKSAAYLKYDHFLNDKQYVYGNASVGRDKFKDLKLKSAIGAGYGHQFFESPSRNLSLEGGLSFVNEDFFIANDDSYTAGRWAIRFDQMMYANRIQFFHNQEGLVDLSDAKNVSITAQTGFRFPILAGMNAALQLNTDWDNSPAPGFKKADNKLLFNVGYLW